MHTNTYKINKFIFKKMVHNKIYHDMIMPMLNHMIAKRAPHLTTTWLPVLQNKKWEGPILKCAGLLKGLVLRHL